MIRKLPARTPEGALGIATQVGNSGVGIFINGEEREVANGFDRVDPFSGEAWYSATNGTVADVDDAVASAADAAKEWSRTTARSRATVLLRVADAIEAEADSLGLLDTLDNGKLLRETRSQAVGVAHALRYAAGGAERVEGVTSPSGRADTLAMTVRVPFGVIGVIVPWNSPAPLLFSTAAPALAAGNAVVVKTSEDAPASIVHLAKIATANGLPPGLLNVISGTGGETGAAIVDHPDVAKVVFTGGSAVGREVAAAAGERLIPAILELGGKSAQIVLEDADLDRVIPGLVGGVFAAAGQTCVAGGRALIHRSIYDHVVEELSQVARGLALGDPIHEETQMGPLGSGRQLSNALRHVDQATAAGANLITGGGTRATGTGRGEFFTPAVLADVTSSNPLFQEEVFGPVIGLTPFDTLDEALALANDSQYGLASGIWTRDIDKAMQAAYSIEAGTVWVNTYRAPETTLPSGGFKDSGIGRLGGSRNLNEFTQEKAIIVNYSGIGKDPFVMGDSNSGTKEAADHNAVKSRNADA